MLAKCSVISIYFFGSFLSNIIFDIYTIFKYSKIVFLFPFFTFIRLLGFKLSCGKSVKYRYIEFFAFDYDSLPISFQSGIAVSFSSS